MAAFPGIAGRPAASLTVRPGAAGVLEQVLLPFDRVFNRLYSSRFNPLYQSGTLAILCLFILVATGLYTLIFYRIGSPYESVEALEAQWWGGRWIRALHTYAADAMVVLVLIHMLRMLIQGRTWGARALAWITGIVLLGGLLFTGWTGFILVWNVHGQLLAVEGAKLLDVLPIFSEPIQRNFIGSQGVASSFFFLNLLIHMLMPLWLLALVWLHTLRIAKPVLLPPRRLTLWTGAALFMLAVVVPVGLVPKASFTALPGAIPIDLVFSAWLIPARYMAAWSTWAVWLAAGLAAVTVPWWWKPRDSAALQPALSNEDLCTGCTQCYQDCPYGAIAMVPAPPSNTGTKLVARVSAGTCVSCGICAGSCAPMVIGPPGRAGKDLLQEAQDFVAAHPPQASGVLVMACAQDIAFEDLTSAVERIQIYPLHCSAAIHTSTIEFLLRKGVGGIYLLTCPGRDCMYRFGPKWLHERIYNNREAELRDRVDRQRVRIGSFGRSETAQAVVQLKAFRAEIEAAAGKVVAEGQVDLGEICEPAEVRRG
jgi:ferredoxin